MNKLISFIILYGIVNGIVAGASMVADIVMSYGDYEKKETYQPYNYQTGVANV